MPTSAPRQPDTVPHQTAAAPQQVAVADVQNAQPAREQGLARSRSLIPVRAAATQAIRMDRRAPVTVVLLLALTIAALTTGALVPGPSHALAERIGLGLGPIRDGQWWVLLTAGLWCRGIAGYLASAALVVLVIPRAERRIGSLRIAGILLLTQAGGAVVALAMVQLIALTGGAWAHHLTRTITVDPAGAVLGVVLAISATAPTLWRRRIRLTLLVALAALALYSGTLADLFRLAAGLTGLAVGTLSLYRPRARAGPTRPEIRILLALVVAASALGPLLVPGSGAGPFSVLRYLLATPPPDALTVHELCAARHAAEMCADLHVRLRLSGAGPAILSVMPALLLLVAAEGLRRGRRAALIAAVTLQVLLAGLGVLFALAALLNRPGSEGMFGPPPHLHGWIVLSLPSVQPLLVAGVLVACRRGFAVRAPAGAYRRWALLSAGTLIGVCALYLGGSLAVADAYDRPLNLGAVLADLPARFVPPWYLGDIEPPFLPNRLPAVLLYEWTGVLFWTVVGVAGLLTFIRPQRPAQAAAATRIRALLAEHGGDNLSYMVTWPGHSYYFTEDSRAAVAYRVVAGVALTTGGPIGDPDRRAAAVSGFLALCHQAGWTPCLYSVGESTVAVTRALGWQDVQVAEETVLPLDGLRFTGKAWQDVRTTMNHAVKLGITAEECRYRTAPRSITDQIRVISEAWVAEKGLPELGFTLGGIDELADDGVRLLIAVDPDRTVHGVTSWLPVCRDGEIVGWTLDFMRRRADGFRGSMEFLIASAALRCQADGNEFLSLSGAPLARVDQGESAAGVQRALDLAARLLEPVYGFRSLLAFKAKFRPVHHPMYLAYADSAALPSIGNAVARAYLPSLTPRQLTRLARSLW
ncbi:MAG: phosphatidylglycerol lysyltransferase [Cryptosporangiaceae bacterium]|nr:phosphatidylglycerol lysyltransferase [Cryptosporangiaceae bacterium]